MEEPSKNYKTRELEETYRRKLDNHTKCINNQNIETKQGLILFNIHLILI